MKKTASASFKKMTHSLLLGGLFTGLTVSASINKQAQLSHELLQANPLTAAIKANATQVIIADGGAIYVLRQDDSYYFWSINSAATQLTLVEQVTVDLAQAQTIDIRLAADTEGLFYADNLIIDSNTRISFNGQLSAGKITIPLSKEAFMPLLDAAPNVQQSVMIDGNTPELLDTVATQTDIYHTAESALLDVQQHTDAAVALMADKVLAYKDILMAEAEHADGLMASYASTKAQLETDLEHSVNADVTYLEQHASDLEAQVQIEITNFEKNSLACVTQAQNDLEASTNQLVKTIDQLEREFDEHPKLEADIERVARQTEQSAAQIDACMKGLGSLEHFTVDGMIDELTYQQFSSRAETLAQQVEAETTQWANDLNKLPDELMLGLQTDAMVQRTESFENRFNAWISPAFQGNNGFLENPHEASKSVLEKDTDDHAWLEKVHTKGQDMLCHDDIGNFDFNITGVGVVIGTFWNDRIITGNESNLVLALTGDDCVETHGGIDGVLGMPGRDIIFLGDDHDFAHGGWGTDFIVGSAGNSYTFSISGVDFEVDLGNLIMGGAGNDFLFGGETFDAGEDGVIEADGFTDIILGDAFLFGQAAGDDTIDGERGIDFLLGQVGNDTITNLGSGVITIAAVPVEFGSYFWGNAGTDSITGSNTPMLLSSIGDFIFGGDDGDIFNANDGRDFVFGADGGDNGTGGGGNDYVFGGPGQDAITGGAGIDLVLGGQDNDPFVAGGAGFDVVLGNLGDDRVLGQDGPDIAMGNQGNDNVTGGNAPDLVLGGPGQDFMQGNASLDIMLGGGERDVMEGNDGLDYMDGGRGTDDMSGNDGIDIMRGNVNDEDGIEIMRGGNGPDFMWGNDGREQMFGNDGLDFMAGNGDNDDIFGGNGLDVLLGNEGNDTINGEAGPDAIFGGNGNDVINGNDGIDFAQGNNGCDIMNGGNQADLFFGNDHDDQIIGGVALDLLFGGAGVDQLFGQQGIDFLSGGGDRDRLEGGDQADIINGNDGNDFMLGGNGLDVMSGQGGNDFINGGNDTDLLMGGNGNDNVNGANGNDLLIGGANNDRINSGNGIDLTFANGGNDRIRAVEGRNIAFGNSGADVLDGFLPGSWDARDILWGNSGNDNLTGESIAQRDFLFGGSGTDNEVRNTTWVTAAEFNGNWVTPAPNCQ